MMRGETEGAKYYLGGMLTHEHCQRSEKGGTDRVLAMVVGQEVDGCIIVLGGEIPGFALWRKEGFCS